MTTPPPGRSTDFTIRPFRSLEDYAECVHLQQETWGDGFRELVPPAVLMISQKVGGVAAGAYDADGGLIGFVFGITGWVDAEPRHWSHMLAVTQGWRNRGVGLALKRYQRDRLLECGVRTMLWTFDPLVSRNAHLNLNRIGARVVEYAPDIYGSNEESTVDSVIGTDRFIVQWTLAGPDGKAEEHPEADDTGCCAVEAPDPSNPLDAPVRHPTGFAACIRIDVPEDIQSIKTAAPDVARAWRSATRDAFIHYLGLGYRVTRFHRHGPSGAPTYVLQK